MANVHMIVGTLVIIGYLVVLVLNLRLATSGRDVSWHRPTSMGAATLLVVQYLLGFSLLSSGNNIRALHYVLALGSIIPVGAEHMAAGTQEDPRRRGSIGAIANVVTLALVLVAYMIGQSN